MHPPITSIYNGLRKKESGYSHALFHLVEGIVLVICALILFEEGKFRLPAFIAFIGCLYVLMGIIGYKLNKDNFRQLGKPILRWVGAAFILFGLVGIIWNWNYDRDKWVFLISGMFILIGAFYAFFAGWIISRIERAAKPKTPAAPTEK